LNLGCTWIAAVMFQGADPMATGAGTFTMVRRNHQTYRQAQSDLVFARWNRPAGTYPAIVIGAAEKFALKAASGPRRPLSRPPPGGLAAVDFGFAL